MSFFQKIVVDLLIEWDYITHSHFYQHEELSEGICALLQIVEMGLLFTLANQFSFDPHE